MKDNQRSERGPVAEGPKANPPRRRGRPPLPAGEAKRRPLILRTTDELRNELVKASKASGRSLTQEIEFRLARSLAEDRGKSELELRVDKAIGELKGAFLVLTGYRGPAAAHETTAVRDAEDLHDGLDVLEAELDRLRTALEADRPAHVIAPPLHARLDRIRKAFDALLPLAATAGGELGEGARLPVELEVARGEDGNVVLVSRRGGLVIRETQIPLDIAAALQLVGEVELAVSVSGEPKRKSRRSA